MTRTGNVLSEPLNHLRSIVIKSSLCLSESLRKRGLEVMKRLGKTVCTDLSRFTECFYRSIPYFEATDTLIGLLETMLVQLEELEQARKKELSEGRRLVSELELELKKQPMAFTIDAIKDQHEKQLANLVVQIDKLNIEKDYLSAKILSHKLSTKDELKEDLQLLHRRRNITADSYSFFKHEDEVFKEG